MKTLVFIACALSATVAFSAEPTSFATPAKLQPLKVREVKVVSTEVDFLGANAARWTVELPPEGAAEAFAIKDGVLKIRPSEMRTAFTTVKVLLPGDGAANGNVWARNQLGYVSFMCRSRGKAAVRMTCHLLMRGKTPGTYQTSFEARPGEWQEVVLQTGDFKLKGFQNVAGIGFRTAAVSDAEVEIRDIKIGGTPCNEQSWANHVVRVNLAGNWLFAPDHANRGEREKWFAPGFDDSKWTTLEAGKSWQAQGVELYGWGWYRQRLNISEAMKGRALTLTLGSTEADDDVWFNGVRIGGVHGAYKYKDRYLRVYAVPTKLVKYGAVNVIATRRWGGDVAFQGKNSGLAKGPFTAEFDLYPVTLSAPGGAGVPYREFDVSATQQGKDLEFGVSFPADLARLGAASVDLRLSDRRGNAIAEASARLSEADGALAAKLRVSAAGSRKAYLSGTLLLSSRVRDASGASLYLGTTTLDGMNFSGRDALTLPPAAAKFEETAYGRLKLVDEIDCAKPVWQDVHPYLESGVDNAATFQTPGIPADIRVIDTLGGKARECGYSSWFAYRIGRGTLKPHATYLLRVEYPDDVSRFFTMEIQTGQNYMDVGYRSGTAPDGAYDNWPVTRKWQNYDVVFPLDDETVGSWGTESASAEHGVWVYFTNKQKENLYYANWDGGPAVGKLKLYEIDPEKNAPEIRYPEGAPRRVFSLDWERQADNAPDDLVAYARLMGYNAVSPIILKWAFANYGDPVPGYETTVIDPQNYWAHTPAAADRAESPWPDRPNQHRRYLETTRRVGMGYIPRIEWGGSEALPESARCVEKDGKPAKPNRFARWCGNLLAPASFDDFRTYLDAQLKPFANENPQLLGFHWRIRCDRQRVSYGPEDLARFAADTGTKLPPGRYAQHAAYVTGAGREAYDAWWHRKRADFHRKVAELLKSYRPDLKMWFYNWDGDKFSLILPCTTAWAFNARLLNLPPGGAKKVYLADEAERKSLTAADYIETMRTGNFGDSNHGVCRADYGIRPALYADIPGIEIFCPANFICYADKPEYLEYFRTHEGVAVSNPMAYDEIASRSLNPKYEGNMLTPGPSEYSMAVELLSWFHSDARTITDTSYTYGRGYADAHRAFACAYLALPATDGKVAPSADADVKVRTYQLKNAVRIGVGYKGYAAKTLKVTIAGVSGNVLTDLVTGKSVPFAKAGDGISFSISTGPMELKAYELK